MARTWGRKGRPWRAVQAKVYAEETHCYLCGKPVDQTLANYRSSEARSVHHLIPPDIEPRLAHARENLRLAHLGCNSKYGRGVYGGPPRGTTPQGRSTGRGAYRRRARHTTVGGWVAAPMAKRDRDW